MRYLLWELLSCRLRGGEGQAREAYAEAAAPRKGESAIPAVGREEKKGRVMSRR